jgi:adenylosuccinate lyase
LSGKAALEHGAVPVVDRDLMQAGLHTTFGQQLLNVAVIGGPVNPPVTP